MSKRIYTTDDVEKGLVAASLDPVKQSKRFELARKTFVSKVVDEGADSRTALEAALEAGVRGMKPLANADERLAKAHADLGLDKSTFQNKLTVVKTGASGFGSRVKRVATDAWAVNRVPRKRRTVIVHDIDELDLTEVAHVEDVEKTETTRATLNSGRSLGFLFGFIGGMLLGLVAARLCYDHATYSGSPWYAWGTVAWLAVTIGSTLVGMAIGRRLAVLKLKRADRREAEFHAQTLHA